MSESKPKIKDLFGISTAEHVQVEGEPNETVPDFEARTPKIAKIVTNQTNNTLKERTDCGHQSAENFINFVKERCEVLQRISDRSKRLVFADESYKSTISELHISVDTHIKELAGLLQDTLQDNLQFIEKKKELVIQEYTLLRELFRAHMDRCDFQFCLDLRDQVLKIECDLRDRELIIKMLVDVAKLYSLLGKNQLAYEIMKEVRTSEIEELSCCLRCDAVCSLCVVELLLGHASDSLQHAKDSLVLAKQTKVQERIACAYGNIGLAFEEMGRYDEAIEPCKKCLQIGREAKNDRVINNGLCNLGRAYQGLGDIEEAKRNFKEAIETPRPPKAYWCDTEDFRFSGDYLLAKLFLNEENLEEAKKQFEKTIKRCEMLRKRIQDSRAKIIFNETQRKPFQYLQHVLLEQDKKLEALVVAEKGRARDFCDKTEGEIRTQLDSEELLLKMIKRRSIAVLFISTLDEVGKLCLWFISSEGKLLKQWYIPYTKCDDMFTELCVALYRTQGRHEIEFRGTTEEECSLINKALELIKHDEPGNSDANSSLLDTTGTSFSTRISRAQASECTQEQLSSEENYTLSDLIDTLSELILSPFREELEQLVSKRTTNDMPRLLIIPQGQTFNIPFAALKLNNNPLCNHVTIIEAFSFNSFAYSTTKSEKRATTSDLKKALIVGNPTHQKDLPRAEEEARSIAEFLDVTPLVKNKATKEAVMEQLPSAPLIHFACHGETGGKGLALACNIHTSYKDCHLTAKDVEVMELDADLVVLSACHTARGQINSEGVLGLARAFQIAGARSVVTALWAIPDGATEYFMKQFYGNLRRGQPIADAIRTTQVTMLESQDFNDVINWGSFKVFGANAKIM